MKIKDGLFYFLIIMVVCVPTVCAIQHDGVLKYDTGDSGKAAGTYGMNPWGHAVLFKNKDTVTVTGIQIYGCKFGTGTRKVFVEIWDKELKRIYRDSVLLNDVAVGQMDVDANNCGAVASWADIPLPNHVVTGDFYVVVFTYSPKPSSTTQGMSIGFTQPSSTASSHTVTGDPNKIDEITIVRQYDPTDIDWMIRAYYSKAVAATPGTTVATLAPRTTQTIPTTAPAASLPPTDQAPASQTVRTESTKAGIGVCFVVLSIMISMLLWKRH